MFTLNQQGELSKQQSLYKEVKVGRCQSTTASAATMNLHLGRYFLLAGLLLLGTWAQEDKECHELVKNRPLDDHTGVR